MAKKKEENRVLKKTLRQLSPGTPVREALENILGARTGALIVMGWSPRIEAMMEGGFRLDVELTPARLYELAKLDGAIILCSQCKKILFANAQLNPDPAIPSQETGIRHRIAERVAKQTEEVVISISQRRSIITVYQGAVRYALRDVSVIINKANQALQTLEKYRNVLRQTLVSLSALEFEDLASFNDVFLVLRRVEMVLRVAEMIERYIVELGTEGRLIEMQLEELLSNVEEEALLLVRDYAADGIEPEKVLEQLRRDVADALSDNNALAKMLGHSGPAILETAASPRGYRILDKIPRLPMPVIENLVEQFGTLQGVLRAGEEVLDEVEGIGEARARNIRSGLGRLREQIFIERHL
ncbi:DNA integrity scanning diadenylate cyclase DisA [Dethiobacter alkaliphilus]|uniref:DNA integrity scanning diadenylate cyclase DisA n=1 Tax=Dethiobacter alkaliphilus TaxID=427926 RepID=UPI002225BCED|nr:DNA integrity scanning diadenylate cyclase DisA [Dethiobacter alkaliphilus]MCW3491391.1 DNA integrity scanning diadenylate cyclase DisA [Dethiobacter alkaliphilus]